MSTAPPSPQDSHGPASQTNGDIDANAHTPPTHPADPPVHAPPSPHEVDIADVMVRNVGHGEGEGGQEGEGYGVAPKGDKDEERAPQRESSIWPNHLPPSPPLTRSSADLSVRAAEPMGVDDTLAADPLEKEDYSEVDLEFSTTLGEHSLDSPVKSRTTVGRKASAIQLDAKLEPQPWDLVDPPETNGQTNAEYYASLKTSQKYNTLGSSRARALIPKSSYYFGPPPSDSAYGTQPIGQIGLHHPREILRVERDYTGGELIQFAPIYPLELEGRITPTQFMESINAINELLISAHSMRHSFLDNALSVFTLQLSRLILTSHYEKEMRRLQLLIDELNVQVYNPAGLNILWPRKVAFLFMEIEYYVSLTSLILYCTYQ
ncbi:Golgin subfamily A member 7/ERF4 family-domain-containing protein [Mycena polygramma]|nr:Golgin subfamily A member 7/ERF4 family-domain-containing protein [Mycena polygramma]